MEKREIYEHLAKIYLDTSKKHKRKRKHHRDFINFKVLFFASILILAVFLSFHALKGRQLASHKQGLPNSQIALIVNNDPVKINYNFKSIKKESYTIDLNGLNLRGCEFLKFSVMKSNPRDAINMRIELTNSFNEKSAVYFNDIRTSWEENKISLTKFKDISDWSGMKEVSFTIEEWNTKEKTGKIYIDNVKFVRLEQEGGR